MFDEVLATLGDGKPDPDMQEQHITQLEILNG